MESSCRLQSELRQVFGAGLLLIAVKAGREHLRVVIYEDVAILEVSGYIFEYLMIYLAALAVENQ